MLYFFVSKKHDYTEQAKRVLSAKNIDGKRIYIEDAISSWQSLNSLFFDDKTAGLDKPVVYFLCNNYEITGIVENFKNNAFFINHKFYTRTWDKEQMFSVLKNVDLSLKIPNHYVNRSDIKESDYPLYVKSIIHQGITFEAKNDDIIEGFSKGVDLDDYYFENNVADTSTKEIKVFYLNGTIIPADKDIDDFNRCKKYNKNTEADLTTIANYFKLDCCSFDIIFNKENQYVIDVNSAPAYYSTKKGTKLFAEYLHKLSKG